MYFVTIKDNTYPVSPLLLGMHINHINTHPNMQEVVATFILAAV